MSWEWKYILMMVMFHVGMFGLINTGRLADGRESLPTRAWMSRHQIITLIWGVAILATPLVFLYWLFTL
jgi:hypothetical protein